MADGATNFSRVPKGTDLVEWYFEQGWTDGLPVVPPTARRSPPASRRSAASPNSSNAACRRATAGSPAKCWRSTW